MGIRSDADPATPAGASGILADPPLRRYLLASLISIAGSAVTVVVLPVLVYQRTGSPAQTAALTGIEVLPYLLLGPLAGPVADRSDRRRVMIISNLVNCLAIASVPTVAAFGQLGVAQLYAVAVLVAISFVFEDAADFGALPTLAGRGRLVRATSLLSGASAITMAIGPAAGGVLIAVFGAPAALTVDATSYAAAAILIAGVRRPFQERHQVHELHPFQEHGAPSGSGPQPAAGSGQPARRRLRSDFVVALRWLAGHRVVRTLTLVGFGNSIAFGLITGLTVVYATRVLQVPLGDARIGVLFTATALGALAGSAVLGALRSRWHPARITQVSLIVSSLFAVTMVRPLGLAGAVVSYTLWAAAVQVTIVNGITYRQQVIPDALQSRVNVLGRMIAMGGQPLGALTGGLLAETSSVGVAYLTAAAVLGATAAAGAPALARAARHPLEPLTSPA